MPSCSATRRTKSSSLIRVALPPLSCLAVLEGGVELDRESRPQVVDLARRNPHGERLQDRVDGPAALVCVGGRSVGHALNERLGGDHLDVRPLRKQSSEVLRQLCAEVGELLGLTARWSTMNTASA